MKFLSTAYRFLNLLSLDVAVGAVVCAAFFARILQVHLRTQGLAALGITVWIIYTVDHLLDVRGLTRQASTKRHLLHQRNFKLLSGLVAIAASLDLYMVFFIRKEIFIWGIGLAAIVLLYLLFQRWLTPFKEVSGAVLYTGGVLMPTLALNTLPLPPGVLLLMISFGMTAFTNLVLFSSFGVENDRMDTQRSLVIFLGAQQSRRTIYKILLLQGVVIAGLLILSTYRVETLILAAMNAILVAMAFFPERFAKYDAYRLVGDAIFLFPLPYLLCHA
jgi:4-hydroxybenzoate polyprenyltransferase